MNITKEDTDSRSFYRQLPVLDSFFEVSNPDYYQPLPSDWLVGVTDIEHSTDAVRHNHYKEVNILGASPIVGLLNASSYDFLPYSFGGDGCSICFPPHLFDDARRVFLASQQIGKQQYELNLRTAIIPVSVIVEKGFAINVARFRVTDYYSQAVFSGGGLDHAEWLLKQQEGEKYRLQAGLTPAHADFTGLECRWQNIKPPGQKVLSILVKCNPSINKKNRIYESVLNELRTVFGFDSKTNPIIASNLNMNLSVPKLMSEARFRTSGAGWLRRLLYVLKTEAQTLLGKFFMYFDLQTSQTNWRHYKKDLALNADHRKFDDMLRLVISGTAEQQAQFQTFLQQMFEDSKLAYGIHVSSSATITCMVFAYERQHIHFIDGSDGGYAKASIDLKKRLKKLAPDPTH